MRSYFSSNSCTAFRPCFHFMLHHSTCSIMLILPIEVLLIGYCSVCRSAPHSVLSSGSGRHPGYIPGKLTSISYKQSVQTGLYYSDLCFATFHTTAVIAQHLLAVADFLSNIRRHIPKRASDRTDKFDARASAFPHMPAFPSNDRRKPDVSHFPSLCEHQYQPNGLPSLVAAPEFLR